MQHPTTILNEREITHGSFETNARISTHLKRIIRSSPSYQKMTPIQQESLDLICTKMSRILSGQSGYKDHWDDICGYALLAAKEIDELASTKIRTPEDVDERDSNYGK